MAVDFLMPLPQDLMNLQKANGKHWQKLSMQQLTVLKNSEKRKVYFHEELNRNIQNIDKYLGEVIPLKKKEL
jgi:hypothetical protein